MSKVLLIARREFVAAVVNRGFLIGLLMMPVLGLLFTVVTPFLVMPRPVEVTGTIAVIDPQGSIAPALREALTPEAVAARREREERRLLGEAPAMARQLAGAAAESPTAIRIADASGAPSDVASGKAWLRQSSPAAPRLAVVVVAPHAAAPVEDDADDYELYVNAGVNGRVQDVLHDAVRDAIIGVRAQAQDVERTQLERLLRVNQPAAVTVAPGGDRAPRGPLNMLLPMVLAALMVLGVMIGGQTLLTSTIEEKSSRVIEVMLSAVSPLQLMAGKILGQLAVSLLVLVVYAGLGIVLLISTALIGLLDLSLVLYLLAFFLITYVFFGAVFAAAGAAVNDMKEAQTLMGPLMLILMGPWLLAFPIMRDPASALAVTLSFVPPVSSFVMMLRLASGTPPPAWQAFLSMGIGVAAAAAAIWFAAKVFRIGLLMHGKPPNLATLIRWARAA